MWLRLVISGEIEPYNGNGEFYSMYSSFNSLKTSHPGLKTLIAVGGWTFDQSRFVYVSSTSSLRSIFASSVVAFLEDNNCKFVTYIRTSCVLSVS